MHKACEKVASDFGLLSFFTLPRLTLVSSTID